MILLEGGKKATYTKWDYLIAEAYQIMQDERCSQCGYPRSVCQSESDDVRFRIELEECAATKAKHDYENPSRGRNGKAKEIPAGTVARPIAFSESGVDLATLRQPFYESLMKKREEALTEERAAFSG